MLIFMFLELRLKSNYYYVYKYTRSILFAGKEAILYFTAKPIEAC